MDLDFDINRNIFREYDIRGVYPKDLTAEKAYTIGRAFGSYIKEKGKKECVVGHDNRLSSPILYESLIEGIRKSGIDVTSLGLVTTPMYYYGSIKLGNLPGVMVTASHNPKDDNGFKIAFDENGNAKGKEIQDFYDYMMEGNFTEGFGNLSTYDIEPEYIELFKNSLEFGNIRRKIVVDPGNGTTSIIVKQLFSMFNIDVDYIYAESDGTFPNHHPDPAVEKNLDGLKKRVLEIGADAGIAFDGDGDRVGVISNSGKYIAADLYMIIIIRDIIKKVNKKEFLYDVKCTKALSDEIENLGGKGIIYRTGNSYTKSAVKDMDLPFGGELSGHVYFRDKFPGFDSGIYAGLRLCEILSKTNTSVDELLNGINKYYGTEELKFKTTDENKFEVVGKIEEYAKEKNYSYLTIDGVKVLFDDAWALVRASNTGPNITARFEASSKERLEELEEEFITIINKNI